MIIKSDWQVLSEAEGTVEQMFGKGTKQQHIVQQRGHRDRRQGARLG